MDREDDKNAPSPQFGEAAVKGGGVEQPPPPQGDRFSQAQIRMPPLTRPPSQEEQQKLLDRLLKFQMEAYSAGLGYEQVMIGLGYAAFLTLWGSMAEHLGRTTVLLSGALIGLSLLGYLGWTIAYMIWRNLSARYVAGAFKELTIPAQLEALQLRELERTKQGQWILTAWPAVLIFSIVTGLAAALTLIGPAFWHVVNSAGR